MLVACKCLNIVINCVDNESPQQFSASNRLKSTGDMAVLGFFKEVSCSHSRNLHISLNSCPFPCMADINSCTTKWYSIGRLFRLKLSLITNQIAVRINGQTKNGRPASYNDQKF